MLLKTVLSYIKSQIQEISSCKSLSCYGIFLSLIHVATFFLWQNNAFIFQYMTKTANSLCWPQIPFCETLKVFSPLGAQFLLYTYLVLALLTAFLFLNRKTITHAYWLFLVINLLKLYMFLMDYQLMNSSHYLHFLVSFAFLFIRQKLFFISLLICFFYLFTGFLQIQNPYWLMKLAFHENIWFPSFINESVKLLICLYVLCLEMIGSLLLIVNTRWRAAFIYIQFILFYLASYFITDYFPPTVFLFLLSLFVLKDYFNEKYKISNFREMISGTVFTSLVIFGSLLAFLIPGKSELTKEGTLYALDRYSVKPYCHSHIILHFKNKTLQQHFPKYDYPLSVRCDPYIDWYKIKKICSYYKKDPDFMDLDWTLDSRLRYSVFHSRLVEEKSVCSKNLRYSSWKKNAWIKTAD